MIDVWLKGVMVVSVPAICFALWWFAFGKRSEKRILRELALFFGAVGLSVQTFRSIYFFEHGFYPVDVGWPMWATKDISICLFFAFVCQLMLERRRAEGKK